MRFRSAPSEPARPTDRPDGVAELAHVHPREEPGQEMIAWPLEPRHLPAGADVILEQPQTWEEQDKCAAF
jgi:hypothetical protein